MYITSVRTKALFKEGETVIRPGDSTIYNVVNPQPQSRARIVVEDTYTGDRIRLSQYNVRRARKKDIKVINEFNSLMEEIS